MKEIHCNMKLSISSFSALIGSHLVMRPTTKNKSIHSTFPCLLFFFVLGHNVVTPSSSSTTSIPLPSSSTTPPGPAPPASRSSSPVRNYGWVIALLVLSSIGILAVLGIQLYVIIKIFFTKGSVPPKKPWRAHWLGQTLLCGIFCSYATSFAFLPYSCPATCAIIRFCVGVSYALCFSALFVKVMIVLGSRHGELSFLVQTTLFFFVWSVQIVIDVQWLIVQPPSPMQFNAMTSEPWGACNPGYVAHVQSLVYIMFLIAACVIFSIQAHGIDANHHEAVYIGLAAGFSIPIWVAWTLIGFLVDNVDWQDPCIAFGLFMTSTWILVIMFLPKMYYLNEAVRGGGIHESYADTYYGPSVYPGSVFTNHHHGSHGNVRIIQDGPSQENLVHGYEPSLRFSGEGSSDDARRVGVNTGGKEVYHQQVRTLGYDRQPGAHYMRHTGAPVYTLPPPRTGHLRGVGGPISTGGGPISAGGGANAIHSQQDSRNTLSYSGSHDQRPQPISGVRRSPNGVRPDYDSYFQPDGTPTTTIIANRNNNNIVDQSYIARAWSDHNGLT